MTNFFPQIWQIWQIFFKIDPQNLLNLRETFNRKDFEYSAASAGGMDLF
jgi:hypothetical protein